MKQKKQLEQRSSKNSMGQFYKDRSIKSVQKDLDFVKESSPSAIFFHKIFGNILDLIMWGLIAYFVYVWWTTRGQP